MDKLKINGGIRLTGEIEISGAKNAALAILAAAILSDEVCLIENVPDITDIKVMTDILKGMGAIVSYTKRNSVLIDPRHIDTYLTPFELTKTIRGSYYFLGALLGRCRHGMVAMPGGCNLGARLIDQHLKGFSALGAECILDEETIEVKAQKLRGTNIYLDVVTVGATINIMLAATRADGITVIENAAKEPHIVDLANFLNTMGADIRGAGTDTIKIRGVKHLHSVTYSIIPDQIEAGTYMAAVAATGGSVIIRGVIPKHLESISSKLVEMGAEVTEGDDCVKVTRLGKIRSCNIKTMPHPGFPTDMQPQAAVLLSLADGESRIVESIFDDRFKYVPELQKMGADIKVNGSVATIHGIGAFHPAEINATDLRAGAAMMIAALSAQGTTIIGNVHYIERGYENYIEKLRGVGADIEKTD